MRTLSAAPTEATFSSRVSDETRESVDRRGGHLWLANSAGRVLLFTPKARSDRHRHCYGGPFCVRCLKVACLRCEMVWRAICDDAPPLRPKFNSLNGVAEVLTYDDDEG